MTLDDNTSDIAEVDEFVKEQAAASERFQAAHRRWFDLWQAEAILLVDFGDKLAQIATKDAKRVIDDNEAAARDIVQLFTNGWTTQQAAREQLLPNASAGDRV